MKPKFKIDKVNLRILRVLGIHPDIDPSVYEEEFTNELGKFTYEETVSLNGLYSIDSDEQEEYISCDLVEHKKDLLEISEFEIKDDGLYSVVHVVIPNEKWLAEYTENKMKGLRKDQEICIPVEDYDEDQISSLILTRDTDNLELYKYQEESNETFTIFGRTESEESEESEESSFKPYIEIWYEEENSLLYIKNIYGEELDFNTFYFKLSTDESSEDNESSETEESTSPEYEMKEQSVYEMPYSDIYYYNSDDKQIYFYNDATSYIEDLTNKENWIPKEAEELFQINLENDNYSAYRETQYTFLFPDLLTCLYKISQSLLDKLCPKNCDSEEFQELTYNRDLLWMGINSIKYLLEAGHFFEAQAILEDLEDCCGGICNSNSKNKGDSGCGCSQ